MYTLICFYSLQLCVSFTRMGKEWNLESIPNFKWWAGLYVCLEQTLWHNFSLILESDILEGLQVKLLSPSIQTSVFSKRLIKCCCIKNAKDFNNKKNANRDYWHGGRTMLHKSNLSVRFVSLMLNPQVHSSLLRWLLERVHRIMLFTVCYFTVIVQQQTCQQMWQNKIGLRPACPLNGTDLKTQGIIRFGK